MTPGWVTGSRGTVHGIEIIEANKAHLTNAWERERERNDLQSGSPETKEKMGC